MGFLSYQYSPCQYSCVRSDQFRGTPRASFPFPSRASSNARCAFWSNVCCPSNRCAVESEPRDTVRMPLGNRERRATAFSFRDLFPPRAPSIAWVARRSSPRSPTNRLARETKRLERARAGVGIAAKKAIAVSRLATDPGVILATDSPRSANRFLMRSRRVCYIGRRAGRACSRSVRRK